MRKPLPPPVYLLASIIIMLGLHEWLPVARLLWFPWTLAGIVPAVVGIALPIACARTFKRHQTTIRPFQVSSSLVRDGLYRFSRNPIYIGLVLLLVGFALLLGSLTPFAVCVGFAVLLHYRFVRMEERMLAERFGAEWQGYSGRVRRWI